MSSSSHKELRCPQCGAVQPTLMWTSITASEQPALRERLLEETLFDFQCKSCGYQAVFYYPCLYHDMEKGFLLYLNPAANAQAVRPQIPQALQPLRKRLVSSQSEMKEKILILESGFDDTAVEIVKLAAENLVRKKTGASAPQLYFASGGQEKLYFAVFPEKGAPQGTQSMKIGFYRQAVELLRAVGYQDNRQFLKVDRNLAQQLLRDFQERQKNNR